MIIKIPKNRLSFLISYENTVVALAVVYFLETIYIVTLYPAVEAVLKVIQFVLLGFVGMIFCIQRISIQNMLIRLTTIAVFALSFAFSGTYPLLKYGLVLLAGVNCDIYRLCRRLLKIYAICIVITFILGVVNVIPSRIVRRGYSTYGFSHINTMAQYFLTVLCCYLIVFEQRFQWKQWLTSACLIVVTAYLTDSRTTIASMTVLIFSYIAIKAYPRGFYSGRFAYYLAIWVPVLVMFISLVLSWKYDVNNTFYLEIDELLNGRLGLANAMVRGLKITAFGQPLVEPGVESAYVTGLYQFGVVPLLVELFIYMYAIRKCLRERAYGILACLLAMAVHGYAEGSSFNPYANVALLTTFQRKQMTLPLRSAQENDELRSDK